MIKNMVFDLGNVIIKWDPEYIITQYTDNEIEQKEIKDKLFKSKYWLMYDEGNISRDDLINKVNESLDEKYHLIIKDIVYYWYKHCAEIEGMADVVKKLKDKGLNIYLLSNTNLHFDEYKDNYKALQYFDGYYISAITKLVKPNKEIYLDFLNKFNLKAEKTFFIDDTVVNIEGAKKVGINGYVFDGDVNKLVAFLKQNSIFG